MKNIKNGLSKFDLKNGLSKLKRDEIVGKNLLRRFDYTCSHYQA